MSDDQPPTGAPKTRRPRGFAAMTPEKRAEISGKGGRAAHKSGKANRFTPEQAAAAGRKGGLARHRADRDRREGEGEGS